MSMSFSIVPESVLHELGLEFNACPEVLPGREAQQETYKSIGKIELQWVYTDSAKQSPETFYVVKSAIRVVLGRSAFPNNNSKISSNPGVGPVGLERQTAGM